MYNNYYSELIFSFNYCLTHFNILNKNIIFIGGFYEKNLNKGTIILILIAVIS